MPAAARPRALLVLFGALLAVHLTGQLTGSDPVIRWTQWALMPVLAALLVAALLVTARPWTRLTRLVLAGLGFSWLGDLVPHFLDGDAAFLTLVGLFAVAQSCYAAAFWPFRRAGVLRRPAALGYVAAAVLLVALCAAGAGPLLPAVAGYAGLITLMAVLATGVHPLTAVGAAVFMVSDALIALGAFAGWWGLWGQGFWVMSTYGVAQLLIVLGVLGRSSEGDDAPRPVNRPGH